MKTSLDSAVLAPPRKTRVLVVDDHVIVREGFVALINLSENLEVCGQAAGVADALRAIERAKPDLLIVDLVLHQGDGMDLIKMVKAQYPEIVILVISMQDETVYAERVLRAGARGYIMKNQSSELFMEAIRTILAGDIYVSRAMNARMLKKLTQRNGSGTNHQVAGLTDRELQIYQMIGSGMKRREIAVSLGISPKTVEAHREKMKQKLGLKDAQALFKSATLWVDGANAE
ncbi:MAG TPA: response regulator transcription factor [Kiritimatiellia bacterium]|nr:response regulator transcription factor [Kiritimatiellia bacterium]HMO99532.1 response regulator transcription factor [Kiritimatiellia bacterium]